MDLQKDEHRPLRAWRWGRLLLLLPFIAMLWVPSYNRIEPSVFGVPFFYWYQLLWVVLCAGLCLIIYRIES